VSDTAEFKPTAASMGTSRAGGGKATPVMFGVAGIGGYAGSICDRLLSESRAPEPLLNFSAVCDPDPSRHPERTAKLADAGVKIYKSFDELLVRADRSRSGCRYPSTSIARSPRSLGRRQGGDGRKAGCRVC
jgi:hypothetical protein